MTIVNDKYKYNINIITAAFVTIIIVNKNINMQISILNIEFKIENAIDCKGIRPINQGQAIIQRYQRNIFQKIKIWWTRIQRTKKQIF